MRNRLSQIKIMQMERKSDKSTISNNSVLFVHALEWQIEVFSDLTPYRQNNMIRLCLSKPLQITAEKWIHFMMWQ